MAQFFLKSTTITNRDATPKVLTDNLVTGGMMHGAEGFVTTGSTTDAVGSTYKLLTVPSSSRIHSLLLSNAILGAGGAVNVGVYYPTFIPVGAGLTAALAGTVISAAFFASALTVATAAADVNILNQSGTNTIALQEQPIWQAIGLAADPMIDLDIVVTVSTVLAAQGLIGLKAEYVR